MRSFHRLFLAAVTALAAVATTAHADVPTLYTGDGNDLVEYNLTDGSVLNEVASSTGINPGSVEVYNGTVYVASVDPTTKNIIVSTYNATTLASENSDFATFPGQVRGDTMDKPYLMQMAEDNGIIYVLSDQGYTTTTNIEAVNATTGAASTLATDTGDVAVGMVAVNGYVDVAGYTSSAVYQYSEATGAKQTGSAPGGNFIYVGQPINAYEAAGNMVADGNTLFVQDIWNETIGTYNLTTGAVNNEFFIDPIYFNNNPADGAVPLLGMTLVGDTLYENYSNGVFDAYNATTGALEATLPELVATTDFSAIEGSGFIDPPPGAGGTLPIEYAPIPSTPEPASAGFALAVLAFVAFMRWKAGSRASEIPDRAAAA